MEHKWEESEQEEEEEEEEKQGEEMKMIIHGGINVISNVRMKKVEE